MALQPQAPSESATTATIGIHGVIGLRACPFAGTRFVHQLFLVVEAKEDHTLRTTLPNATRANLYKHQHNAIRQDWSDYSDKALEVATRLKKP